MDFVQDRFVQEIRTRTREIADNPRHPNDEDVLLATDDVIHGSRLRDGRHLIELFVEEVDLTADDAEIVLGWRDAFFGMFRLGARNLDVVTTTNLVDDLEYRLFATQDSPAVRAALSPGGYLVSRVVPVQDLWMVSGGQRVIPRRLKRLAFGMAAEFAQNEPSVFFRNPKNLEKARAMDRKQSERFVEMFGAQWIVGTPDEVERRWREFMTRDLPDRESASRLAATMVLPRQVRGAKTVGLIADPEEGIYFLVDFGVFLDALHDPESARKRKTRKVVLGYLEEDSVSPAIFDLIARHRPEQLNQMFAVALGRPGFEWNRDGKAVLAAHNPEFLAAPRFPSSLPMSDELLDGLRYVNAAGEARSSDSAELVDELVDEETLAALLDCAPPVQQPSRQEREKAKKKRKQARQARKRNR